MRKIDKQAIQAFMYDRKFNQSNTSVNVDGDKTFLLLHGERMELTENDKRIIQAIRKTPMERDKFTKYYDIDIATAHRLIPYICICKDGIVRVRSAAIAAYCELL